MSVIDEYTGAAPTKLLSQEDLNTAITYLFSYLKNLPDQLNDYRGQLLALLDAEIWASGTTYNQTGYTVPSAVYASDGYTYICIGTNVTTNPTGDAYPADWLRAFLSQNDIVLQEPPSATDMTGTMVGGAYYNNADHPTYQIDFEPFSVMSSDGQVNITSNSTITLDVTASGANGMVDTAISSADLLLIYALHGSSGTCLVGLVSGTDDIDLVTLPTGYDDDYKLVGIVPMLNGTDLPSIHCQKNRLELLKASEAIAYTGVAQATFTAVSLSGIIPDDLYTAVEFGMRVASTTMGVAFSADGTNTSFTIYNTTGVGDTDLASWAGNDSMGVPVANIINNQIYAKSSTSSTFSLLVRAVEIKR